MVEPAARVKEYHELRPATFSPQLLVDTMVEPAHPLLSTMGWVPRTCLGTPSAEHMHAHLVLVWISREADFKYFLYKIFRLPLFAERYLFIRSRPYRK